MIETKRLSLIPVDCEMLDSLTESDLAFSDKYGVIKVVADTLIDNVKSQNVLTRCGFSTVNKEQNKIWFVILL